MSIDLCPRSWRPELLSIDQIKALALLRLGCRLKICTFVTLVRQKYFVLHKYTFTVYEDNHVNDDKTLLPSALLATQSFP